MRQPSFDIFTKFSEQNMGISRGNDTSSSILIPHPFHPQIHILIPINEKYLFSIPDILFLFLSIPVYFFARNPEHPCSSLCLFPSIPIYSFHSTRSIAKYFLK